MARPRNLVRAGAALGALAGPGPATALTAEDAVQPNRNRIALCKEGMAGIARRSDATQAEMEARLAHALRGMEMDNSHVPHIGWGIFGFFEQRRDDTDKAIADTLALIAAGDCSMHLPSLGWITRNGLDARIAEVETEPANLRSAVTDRTPNINRDLHE